MSIKQKYYPTLRFSGFEKSYKKSKIGDFYNNLRTGMTPSRTKPHYFKGNNLWITSGELNYNYIDKTSENITDAAIKNTNLVLYPPNTLFIAITGLEASGTRGRCAFNKLPAATNQSCLAFLKNESIDSVFLFYWYQKYSEKLYFKFAQGTKQQSFNNKIVKKFILIHPEVKEQQKIATFLASVDKKISQLQNKKDLLQDYKKGVMQQIFSQELRFQDGKENDFPEWEEKVKLKELVVKERKIRYGIVQPGKYNQNGRFLIRGKDYSSGWEIPDEFFKVSDEIEKKYSKARVCKGDVIICIVGSVGNLAIIPDWLDGANITQTTARIAPNPLLMSNQYIYYFLQSQYGRRMIFKYIKVGTRPGLNIEDVEDFEILLPRIKEQKKIANLLSAIDEKIELVNTQLENTQQFKKGLLQQMFV